MQILARSALRRRMQRRLSTSVTLKRSPVDSGGQRGLFKLDSAQDLTRRLPQTLSHSRTGQVLLEQFVEGNELNVIAIVREGAVTVLTLSDRLRPPGRRFRRRLDSSLPIRAAESCGQTGPRRGVRGDQCARP